MKQSTTKILVILKRVNTEQIKQNVITTRNEYIKHIQTLKKHKQRTMILNLERAVWQS